MKRWVAGLPVLLALVACGAVSPVATVGSPSASGERTASPTSSPLSRLPVDAVLVDLTTHVSSYTVSLVSSDGGVSKQMVGLKRTEIVVHDGHAIQLPYVSTTLASLYYLDGDSVVHGMRINSAPPADVKLDVPSGSEAAFAVSPDDSKIAVAVLDYTKTPVHLTLYVDDLAGGHKHVIFESSSSYVWPVAWHSGLLVLAHAYGPFEESIAPAAPARDNPYSAISYHVVDPATANRQVLMGACTVSGPLSPAGSGCIQGGTIDWLGNTTDWSTNDWGTRSSAAALSPDGQWVAAENPADPSQMGIWRRSDGLMANYVDGPGLHDWAGWFDSQTIVIGSEDGSWQPRVVTVTTSGPSPAHFIAAKGFFAGLFPTNIV